MQYFYILGFFVNLNKQLNETLAGDNGTLAFVWFNQNV